MHIVYRLEDPVPSANHQQALQFSGISDVLSFLPEVLAPVTRGNAKRVNSQNNKGGNLSALVEHSALEYRG